MNKILSPILLFFSGFLLMAMIVSVSRCSKYGDPLDEPIPELKVDLESIKKTGTAIESAFLLADQTVIDSLVLAESRELYKGKELPYTKEELAIIGNAFKARELTTSTVDFAEFTYSIDGKISTLTIACETEGVWKIIRY